MEFNGGGEDDEICGLFQVTVPYFSWMDLGEPGETSLRTVGSS
jgi:hypothetical protein